MPWEIKSGKKRCFELYKKLIIEEFCNLKFITPFITAKCTSHIEAYHASHWSQYCSKNVSHNIRSRVTEARVAASIINYNELKAGFIELVNSLDEMQSWKISDRTGARLIRHALNNKYWSEKTRWQKKGTKVQKNKKLGAIHRQCAWLQRKVIRTKLSTRTFPALSTSFYE